MLKLSYISFGKVECMKVRVSDYIAKKIVESGITRAFCVTGGGAMFLNDALGHRKGLEVLYNHHEQASAIAAESYARINNKMALLSVTTGPGGTNAITGVVGAWLDSIPMLVISGQVKYEFTKRSTGLNIRALGDQEFDICESISCMTKYSEMIIDPLKIRYCLEKAIYLAKTGRPGPTWLDIPLDVQSAFVEEDELEGFLTNEYEDEKIKDLEDSLIEEIIEKIKNAKRPVLNAGNGIRIGDAHKEFLKLVDRLGIPVVVGWNSEDCLHNEHKLYAGRPGNFGDRAGNFTVQNSDLVLSIGSRLSLRQVGFNYKTWAREAFVIVNDIDKEELKKPTLHVDIPVHADCKDFINLLLEKLDKKLKDGEVLWDDTKTRGLKDFTWIETIKYWNDKYPVCKKEFLEEDETKFANVYAFIKHISENAKENQITVVGNGSACVVGGHSYIIKKGQRFISNSAVASMGYDLPAAIGAYIANKDIKNYEEELILVTGEGSIQMNLQELQTIIHHKMNIKIFLINNGGYHSIRQTQKKFFSDKVLVGIGEDSGDLSFPDMEKLAYAYGYPFIRAKTNSELEEAVKKAYSINGPVICEAIVTREQNFEPKSSGKQLANGKMVSPPLEDLVPFLSDEELDSNMIVKRVIE